MEEVFEKRSNLVMPTHYVELDSEEMSYVDGGWFTDVCKWGGAILGGLGLVSSLTGLVLSFTPVAPVGHMVVAWGLLAYMGGMYLLAMVGAVNIKDVEFPELPH